MAHYPYVNLTGSAGGCTTELTQIAAASTRFLQNDDYLSTFKLELYNPSLNTELGVNKKAIIYYYDDEV